VRGYVVRDERGLYSLNDAFRSRGLGWGGDVFARLVAMAKPAMDTLCAELGETILLGMLADDGSVRFLAKSVAQSVIRYDVELNKVSPAYCTAIGRVLLSRLPRDRRDSILAAQPRSKLTANTVVDLDKINALIDQAGEEGYAIVTEEVSLDAIGVAVPICGPDGAAVAALDVGCVASRFAGKREDTIAALKACVAALPTLFSSQSPVPVAAT